MSFTGPKHIPPKPIQIYFFDENKLPTSPNDWVPWSTSAGPAVSSNSKIWDGSAWVNVVGSTDGRQQIDLERINGTDLTAADWTLIFQTLNDETNPGLARAIGLPSGVITDALTDKTLRRLVEELLTTDPSHESTHSTGTITALASKITLDTGQYGGRGNINIYAQAPAGVAMDFKVSGSYDGVTYYELYSKSLGAATPGTKNHQHMLNSWRFIQVERTDSNLSDGTIAINASW